MERAEQQQTDIKNTLVPMTKKEAVVHKNANKAIQEELKTKQEELKTIGLEKQVKQEDAKTEQIKSQTQMTSTLKGLIWIVGLVSAAVVLRAVFTRPAQQAIKS